MKELTKHNLLHYETQWRGEDEINNKTRNKSSSIVCFILEIPILLIIPSYEDMQSRDMCLIRFSTQRESIPYFFLRGIIYWRNRNILKLNIYYYLPYSLFISDKSHSPFEKFLFLSLCWLLNFFLSCLY